MPSVKTEITEIATGLAMLGYQDLNRALEVRPRHITHVDEAVFDRLQAARDSGRHDADFEMAWLNGVNFARSELGLRGRPPWSIEWKGHHKPASKSIETIPADLRIDHVFLISCKYHSKILHNSGPVPLFDHCLAPIGPIGRSNWFETVSPDSFWSLWGPIYERAGLPAGVTPSTATMRQREEVKRVLDAEPIDTTSLTYLGFIDEASRRTASRWKSNVHGADGRAEMFWRLLRMQAAPYFVLGARAGDTPVSYRVGTPWDFAQSYTVDDFDVVAGGRGQPSIDWSFHISDRAGASHTVEGHVEVRWSHGKLAGPPEAKVYLDTDPATVPGYDPL